MSPNLQALVEELFHLHRRQAMLHNLDRAVDRIGDTHTAIENIPTEKGFMPEGKLNAAGKQLAAVKALVMELRDDVARSVDESEKEIGDVIGWKSFQ